MILINKKSVVYLKPKKSDNNSNESSEEKNNDDSENTKKNSEAVLRKVAEKLKAVHGMTVDVLVHKSQRASLKDSQIQELQGKTDFAILGVGD